MASSNQTFGFSVRGCSCFTECATSFDSLVPWCRTSPEDRVSAGEGPAPGEDRCGTYSLVRGHFWDTCVLRTPNLFTTFSEMWTGMVIAAMIAASAVYLFAGVQAWYNLGLPKRALPVLLVGFGAWGGTVAFAASALVSALLAQLYLSLPYSLPPVTAYTLGVSQAVFLVYGHLARGAARR
jgi:hypothetical protein